jgi:hypothetical protein
MTYTIRTRSVDARDLKHAPMNEGALAIAEAACELPHAPEDQRQ